MSSPFAHVVGGGLKLKGAVAKKKSSSKGVASPSSAAAEAAPASGPDLRTAAERAFDERAAAEARRQAVKAAAKTHREKVSEFNTYLSKLSEHHDIPRVGPG